LIQLKQLRRECEKLKIQIGAPELILRLGDLTAPSLDESTSVRGRAQLWRRYD
jgi:hypothetical protein